MDVHPRGYYQWLKQPKSRRERDDEKLKVKVKQYWLASSGHSGYRNVHLDLVEAKVDCGRDRVLRLIQQAGLKAIRGYKAPLVSHAGKPNIEIPNHLDRQFEVDEPNRWWVSDITYIHTHEGFLFLAVVIDLFSRTIVG